MDGEGGAGLGRFGLVGKGRGERQCVDSINYICEPDLSCTLPLKIKIVAIKASSAAEDVLILFMGNFGFAF